MWFKTELSSSKLTFMIKLDVYWWLTKVKSERVYKKMESDEFYLRRYCKFNQLRQAFRTVYCKYCLWQALSISLIAQNLCFRMVDLRCHVTDGKTKLLLSEGSPWLLCYIITLIIRLSTQINRNLGGDVPTAQ